MTANGFGGWSQEALDTYRGLVYLWADAAPGSNDELLLAAALADLCEEHGHDGQREHWRAWAAPRTRATFRERPRWGGVVSREEGFGG